MHAIFIYSCFFIFTEGETHHWRELIASANTRNSAGLYFYAMRPSPRLLLDIFFRFEV